MHESSVLVEFSWFSLDFFLSLAFLLSVLVGFCLVRCFKGTISGLSFLRMKMYVNKAATIKMAIRMLESKGNILFSSLFRVILHLGKNVL